MLTSCNFPVGRASLEGDANKNVMGEKGSSLIQKAINKSRAT